VIWEQTPGGKWFPHYHQFVETATGLNFKTPEGNWEPSVEQIEPSPGGAAATQGQHKVTFAANLATTGAINLQMPDGQQLQTELIGLCYSDFASGHTVFIAIVTNCTGEIFNANQVWYENAFCGLKGSVRYTYTKAGFEQDVMLQECPLPPESYGLSSATTVLQAVTGVESAPSVSVTASTMRDVSQISDQTIRFPTMTIGHGRAFLIGDNNSSSVPVTKQWEVWSGQRVLVEQVPVSQIAAQLQTLQPLQSSASKFSNSVANVVSAQQLKRKLAVRDPRPMKFAGASPAKSGFILDYITLNGTQSDVVFQGDTTYYISGNLNLYGANTVFEGNAVLKFASNATLTVYTPVTWQGKAYRPVVMLAKDDDGTGELISGSTGNPGTNYYAAEALYFDGTTADTNLIIDNLRIANARVGVTLNGQSDHVLNDVQCLKCGTGISSINTTFSVHNALFYNVLTNFNENSATGAVEQVTSDIAALLNQSTSSDLYLTNCLLVSVTNVSNCVTDHTATLTSGSGVFQVAGPGGLHYLAADSPYRNFGTPNISSATLGALQQKTTYPPIVYSNTVIAADTTFGPQAQRDTDTPDLGYHYDPLDWVFGQVISNANLTFTAGTAVGWFRTSSGNRSHGQPIVGVGLNMANSKIADFRGTETTPDYWVRCNTVQEQDGTGGYGPGGITGSDDQFNEDISVSPEVHLNFTRCSMMAGDRGGNHFRDDWGYLIIRAKNSEFWCGNFGGYVVSCDITNCLLDRWAGGQVEGHTDDEWMMRNCTFHGGHLYMSRSGPIPVSIRDCSFDGTLFSILDSFSSDTNLTDYKFNAVLDDGGRNDVEGGMVTLTNGSSDLVYFDVTTYSSYEVDSFSPYSGNYFDAGAFIEFPLDTENGGSAIDFPVTISVYDYRYSLLSQTLLTAASTSNLWYVTWDGSALNTASVMQSNVVVATFDWQTNWLGNYYLPPGSPLIDIGDTNANWLGLYHFTTQTNQLKETNSIVDIGYHYVAVDSDGNPIDSNTNGTPDYLEDANGNGVVDSGEIGWNTNGDPGLKVLITRPKNNSLLP
jgi:hypothetical protein